MIRLVISIISLSLALAVAPSFAEEQGHPIILSGLNQNNVAKYLKSIGAEKELNTTSHPIDKSLKESPTASFSFGLSSHQNIQPYLIKDHQYGFIAAGDSTASLLDIEGATTIAADKELIGRRLRITLDKLRVYKYPGSGIHTILFEFSAKHQVEAGGAAENVRFAQMYKANEHDAAGVVGYPIFVGLKVGEEGMLFTASTTNVSNEDDEKFLAFLDGPVFKTGLTLLNTSNPLTPAVTELTTGLAKGIASKNKNIGIQYVDMGIDFSNISTRARLREGSYIIVQASSSEFDWTQWAYSKKSSEIIAKDGKTNFPYNYFIVSVSKMGS